MYSTYNTYTHITCWPCLCGVCGSMTAFHIRVLHVPVPVPCHSWLRKNPATCKLHTAYSIDICIIRNCLQYTPYNILEYIPYTVIVSFHYFGNAAYIFGVPNAKLSHKKQTFIHTDQKVSNSNSIEIKHTKIATKMVFSIIIKSISTMALLLLTSTPLFPSVGTYKRTTKTWQLLLSSSVTDSTISRHHSCFCVCFFFHFTSRTKWSWLLRLR